MIRTVHLTHQVVEWWHRLSIRKKDSASTAAANLSTINESRRTIYRAKNASSSWPTTVFAKSTNQVTRADQDEAEIMMLMQNSAPTRFNIVRIIEREQANNSKLPTITKYPPYESAMRVRLNNGYQPFRPQNQAFSSVSSLLCIERREATNKKRACHHRPRRGLPILLYSKTYERSRIRCLLPFLRRRSRS